MAISINVNQSLKEVFKDEEEYKKIQNCVIQCNQQIVNEQKSCKDLTYSNKYNIITIAALTAILAFAMLTCKVTACVVLPSLYVYGKILSLESKANKKALETKSIFFDIFCNSKTQQTCKTSENTGLEKYRAWQKNCRNFSMFSLFMGTLRECAPISTNSLENFSLENLSLENLKSAFPEFNSIALEELRILLEGLNETPLGILEIFFPELQAIPIQNLHGRFSAAELKRICPELTEKSSKLEGNVPEKLKQLRSAKKIALKDVKNLLTGPSLKKFELLIRVQKAWNMKKIKEVVWERANEGILGSLEKVIFIQMIKDHNYARKIQDYKAVVCPAALMNY